MSKFNKETYFLLCIIDVYSKYAWGFLLKDKKDITITNAFQQILGGSNRKRKQIWIEKSRKFYKRSMKLWIEGNYIEMYSTQNEEKSVVAERFIRTLKNKIYQYMTSVSKYVYINKDEIVNKKYNNTYHSTIKMKFVDLNSSIYIDFDLEFKLVTM